MGVDSLGIMMIALKAWKHNTQLSGVTMQHEKLLEFQMAKYESALETHEKDAAEAHARHQQQLAKQAALHEQHAQGLRDSAKMDMVMLKKKMKNIGLSGLNTSLSPDLYQQTYFDMWRMVHASDMHKRKVDRIKADLESQLHMTRTEGERRANELNMVLKKKMKASATNMLMADAVRQMQMAW